MSAHRLSHRLEHEQQCCSPGRNVTPQSLKLLWQLLSPRLHDRNRCVESSLFMTDLPDKLLHARRASGRGLVQSDILCKQCVKDSLFTKTQQKMPMHMLHVFSR